MHVHGSVESHAMSGEGEGERTSQAVLSSNTAPGSPGDILHNPEGTSGRTYSPEHLAPASQDHIALRIDRSTPALRAGLLCPPLLPSIKLSAKRLKSKYKLASAEIAERAKCKLQGFQFLTLCQVFDMHGGPRTSGRLGSSSFAGRCAGTRTPMPSCRAPASEGPHRQPNGRAHVMTAARSRKVMWMDVDAGVDDAQGDSSPQCMFAVSTLASIDHSAELGLSGKPMAMQAFSWPWSLGTRTCLASASSMAMWYVSCIIS